MLFKMTNKHPASLYYFQTTVNESSQLNELSRHAEQGLKWKGRVAKVNAFA